MSKPAYPHTASNDFVFTGRGGKAEEKQLRKNIQDVQNVGR